MTRKTWLGATIFTLAIALIAGLLSMVANGRFTWDSPEIPRAQCEALTAASVSPLIKTALSLAYQERVSTALVRESQNTWSNLAFVFVGALIWPHDRRTFARLFAAALIALGLASGLYHASLLPSWRTVDVATMGWVSFSLCCLGYSAAQRRPAAESSLLETLTPREPRDLWIGMIGGALAMTAAVFRNDVRLGDVKPFDTTYTTIAGIGGVFILALIGILRATRAHPATRLPVARLLVLAAVVASAVVCQLNDRPGRCFCAPDSAVQAHAVWHVLMAAAAALSYEMFAFIEGRPVIARRPTSPPQTPPPPRRAKSIPAR